MKAYGIPRISDLEYPDRADIANYGLKGYRLRRRKATRRYFKKIERRRVHLELKHEIALFAGTE